MAEEEKEILPNGVGPGWLVWPQGKLEFETLEVDGFQAQKQAEYEGYMHVATKGDGRYMVIVMARPKQKKKPKPKYKCLDKLTVNLARYRRVETVWGDGW